MAMAHWLAIVARINMYMLIYIHTSERERQINKITKKQEWTASEGKRENEIVNNSSFWPSWAVSVIPSASSWQDSPASVAGSSAPYVLRFALHLIYTVHGLVVVGCAFVLYRVVCTYCLWLLLVWELWEIPEFPHGMNKVFIYLSNRESWKESKGDVNGERGRQRKGEHGWKTERRGARENQEQNLVLTLQSRGGLGDMLFMFSS